jgi:ribose 1,5-bisphosphokinase
MSVIPPRGAGLVYLMGASGSGKDTLLRHVRAALGPRDRLLIAQRHITRAADGDEASVALTPAEFERRAQAGDFALHWHSHGLSYGIGVEIDAWMNAGNAVLVNGSRAHLPQAFQRYPGLCAVEIVVDDAVLAQRLRQRGREDAMAIAERLARGRKPFPAPRACQIRQLRNDGDPAIAGQALLELARDRAAYFNRPATISR